MLSLTSLYFFLYSLIMKALNAIDSSLSVEEYISLLLSSPVFYSCVLNSICTNAKLFHISLLV